MSTDECDLLLGEPFRKLLEASYTSRSMPLLLILRERIIILIMRIEIKSMLVCSSSKERESVAPKVEPFLVV